MSKRRNDNLRIVDTNVPLVANRLNKQDPSHFVSDECIQSCIEALQFVTDNMCLVLDEAGEIFEEYCHKLRRSGQPGVGDAFFKWVCDNQYSFHSSQRVAITRAGDSYREYPEHDDLKHFDPADRKFLAVANAHPNKPTILQALDRKWMEVHRALQASDISVLFLCENDLQAAMERKPKSRKRGS